MTTFEQDLLAFRKHARILRKLGYVHVSVKWNSNEFHVEGPPPIDSEAVGQPIGFHSEEEEEDE